MAGERDPFLSRLSHPRYLLFLGVMTAAAMALLLVLPAVEAVITAFDLGVIAFVTSCVPLWRSGNAEVMRRQAKRDDVGQIMLLMLTAVITSVILAALGTLVLDNKILKAGEIALLVVTLLSCWTFVNLIYAFHYARLYYSSRAGGDHEGLDFPGDCVPDFSDFVNFAFVIGMTCQTADIAITQTSVRRVSTFHGLFAFAFNLGILALTVNVLASTTGGS
ncbi:MULTISPECIES: DUF1345 domain-containing protein [Sphingomonadaceae]|uniref:DUF1345 domain-containing protein n=1 Tax=Sphingomonadaceae TaxID=41297 RepID=UPI001158C84D|nr:MULTISPECIES: DUF1345 domain-containing protein [Sphingomonadaceae]QDK32413.1 DUF1345 domain-containing protein [Sphingomonas sp. IC081]QSR18678.1 hypothetical protein CA833_16030 [Novosphingobium sp. KA1]